MKYKLRETRSSTKLIFALVITTIIVVILSFSKYTSTKAGDDSISVATPILSMTTGVVNVEINPVDSKNEYIFKVQNYDDDNTTSEVTMEYTIEIKNLANLPLEFELYTYENDTLGNTDLLDDGNETDTITIICDEDTYNTYKLIINWREGETDYKYNGVLDYVQIILNSNQVD